MTNRVMSAVAALASVVLALAWLRGTGERVEPVEARHRTTSERPRPAASRRDLPPVAHGPGPDRGVELANEAADPGPDPEGPSEAERAELAFEEFAAHALGDRLEKRGEEVRRQERGRERFERGVAEGGFSAKQMDPAVVAFFNGVDLEPRLDQEGMLEGLEVTDLDEDSPLRDAGFRRGDRITWIDEHPLRDPAEVPALLVALGHEIRFCGEREGEEICADVYLE